MEAQTEKRPIAEVSRANCWNVRKSLAGGVSSPFGANQLNHYVMAALEEGFYLLTDGCISIPAVHHEADIEEGIAKPDQAISAL